jgi:cytochrome b involved in lipid metabolism
VELLQAQKDQKLLIIDNKVYDVTEFHQEHPGGSQVLLTHVGKDASGMENTSQSLSHQSAQI